MVMASKGHRQGCTSTGKFTYDPTKMRPGGMSDDSEYSGSDDDDYDYGFESGEKINRRKVFQRWKQEEPKLTPVEQLQNACSDKNCDLGAIKAVLAENNININDALFPAGWTLLMLACKHLVLEIVEYLITEKADVNHKAKDWYTPLIAVANSDSQDDSDMENIAEILLSKNAFVDSVETHGLSPLMFAVKNKRSHLVRMFLEKGANVNLADNTGMTALHFAAQVGNGRIVRLLLEKGADATLQNESDTTPLQIAKGSTSQNCLKVIQILEWVDTTQWRPGMHPDMIDVENPEQSAYFSEEAQKYCNDQTEQVKLYLIVHDMEKYVPLFEEQMIPYSQFFWMNHKQLLEIGIEDEDDRYKIINDHDKCRKKDQICPPFMRDGYTSSETLCILTNIGNHIEYQTNLLEGFYHLIRDNPESLNSGIDTYTPTDLIEGSKKVSETTYILDKAVAELYTALTNYEKDSKRKATLLNNKNSSNRKLAILGIVAVSVSVGIGVVFIRNYSK